MRNLFAGLLITATATTAFAVPTSISFVAVDNSSATSLPAGALTYDLVISHSAGDFFTGGELRMDITNGSFFDLNPAADTSPSPADLIVDPDNAFDSYVASPDTFPNANIDPTGEFLIPPNNDLGASIDGARFGNVANGEDGNDVFQFGVLPPTTGGSAVIARVTIVPTGSFVLVATGNTISTEGAGTLFPFAATIPEPGTLALLGLGALGLIRRR